MHWQLWQVGPVEKQVDGITPLLASWEKSSDPAQIRLRTYLDAVVSQLLPLPENVPLYLHLDVDIQDPQRLLRHYDLENYLTPLFGSRCLPSARFTLVTARKYVGGGSRISWGLAVPANVLDEEDWSGFSMNAGRGASQLAWKERIRTGLALSSPALVPPGPARVRLAWRLASRRNWSSLWKPTGDAMGPVLGCADARKPYHLDDDRIVNLEFHRNVDDEFRHDVHIGMWWRAG